MKTYKKDVKLPKEWCDVKKKMISHSKRHKKKLKQTIKKI